MMSGGKWMHSKVDKIYLDMYEQYKKIDEKDLRKKEQSFANPYFKQCETKEEQLLLFQRLLNSKELFLFASATLWIKKNSELININYFYLYEQILLEEIDTWYHCDQYCYRVLNPLIVKYPTLFAYVLKWAKSNKVYVKRAAAVCLINSSVVFSVSVPFRYVNEVCDILLEEDHLHIQKAVGWLLKYAYLSYPEETLSYLKNKYKQMSAITYTYALEKMPKQLKEEMRLFRKNKAK